MSLYNGEASVVCLSVRLSVNFCANRFFSQANGRIATKLSQDGLQVSVHLGCAQGQNQGQRSRDTRTFLDSWNELLRYWRSGFLFVFRYNRNPQNFVKYCSMNRLRAPPSCDDGMREWPSSYIQIRLTFICSGLCSSDSSLLYLHYK